MTSLMRIATIVFGILLGSQATAATQLFDWEVRATFDSVGTIGGVDIDSKEFVISGQTTSALSGTPWTDDPVSAPLNLSSLSLTFDGASIGTVDTVNFFTYGLLGVDAQMKAAPVFSFNQGGDFRAATNLDSILFQMDFGGVDTWLGFGGEGSGVSGGKRVGITTTLTVDGTVDFGEDSRIQLLNAGDNTRTSTLAPVPLPAAAWLLVSALGGLALIRRRIRMA